MHLGSPEHWVGFLESQVPAIVTLIIDAWESMPPPAGNELEDRISETLCRLLRQSRASRDLPFQIHPQLVELDPAAGEDQGRMDIAFLPLVNREDIYFCLECKRLNVRDVEEVRPYFAEYVQHGVFRFVRGQYSNKVRFGGMLAFVLDGNVQVAIAGVENNLQMHHRDLGLEPPGRFQPSKIRPDDDRLRETEHRRRITDQEPFLIQHFFMAGDPNAPLRKATSPGHASTRKGRAKTPNSSVKRVKKRK